MFDDFFLGEIIELLKDFQKLVLLDWSINCFSSYFYIIFVYIINTSVEKLNSVFIWWFLNYIPEVIN